MYESISIVGERGQITLPKLIREVGGIKEKDKVLVKIENNHIIVEKVLAKKEREALMIEGYKKMSKLYEKTNSEWEVVDSDANKYIN